MPSVAPDATHRRRMLRFGGAGLLSGLTDFVVFGVAISEGVPVAAANVLAFQIANIQSYFLNARLTFTSGGVGAPLSWRGYGKFLFAHVFSLAFSTAIVAGLAPVIGPWPAKIIAVAAAAMWNYSASAYFVFRENKTRT